MRITVRVRPGSVTGAASRTKIVEATGADAADLGRLLVL